ncbi:DNA repair protein RadA [Myxococcota bacterium]|jgi:DNA repair protein RadA/Sms|nr:DNA repair protein RadA [Myxococcota bacterium]
MAKDKSVHVCQACGFNSTKWLGRCPECGAWDSLVEQRAPTANSRPLPSGGGGRALGVAVPVPIRAADTGEGEVRLRTGVGELDRVLGGGLVTGSLTLLGGDPGVGKSTLLLTVLDRFSRRGLPTLYVSAEESARQVRLRAERLGIQGDTLFLLAETELDRVFDALDQVKPRALVLDSVQTLTSRSAEGVPGSILQVREVATRAMQVAKGLDIATFLVGHITKDGGLAGPKTLEHLVDAVLYFEGDGMSPLRVLRSHKNRFGATGELGFFEMRDVGLVEVPDASARLLAERVAEAPGTVVTSAMEGSRPLLAEVQALVGRPTPSTPGRTSLGLDKGRLSMLIAVLGKLGQHLHDRDVFVSAAGGLRLPEPAADLAIAAALVGSLRDRALPPDTLVFGEVGLVGEVRGVAHPGPRLAEAARHGFRRVVIPAAAAEAAPEGVEVIGVRTLKEALVALFS